MLTREHAIAEYKQRQIIPDKLCPKNHGNYPGFAEKMIGIYNNGLGKTRNALHYAVKDVFKDEPGCPSRRIDAFCKLLDDQCQYHKDIKGKAANLRQNVFRLAAPYHPLVQTADRLFEHSREDVKKEIAKKLDKPWEEIENSLFADVTEYHRLKSFDGFSSVRELLSRYNIGQLQVALYRAVSMVVWTGSDYKTILRYAKLAKLMHTIEKFEENRYRIIFDGPASVLRNTRRYGVNMAVFLPALIGCGDWSMSARIATRRKGFYVNLEISRYDNYKTFQQADDAFDSTVEEQFAEKWGEEKRNGWTLRRESDILCKGQKVFLPDFTLTHEDGRKVLLEIVGFWTPEYLKEKAKTLELFKDENILLAVAGRFADDLPPLPLPVITYKSSLLIKDVMNYLENL